MRRLPSPRDSGPDIGTYAVRPREQVLEARDAPCSPVGRETSKLIVDCEPRTLDISVPSVSPSAKQTTRSSREEGRGGSKVVTSRFRATIISESCPPEWLAPLRNSPGCSPDQTGFAVLTPRTGASAAPRSRPRLLAGGRAGHAGLRAAAAGPEGAGVVPGLVARLVENAWGIRVTSGPPGGPAPRTPA